MMTQQSTDWFAVTSGRISGILGLVAAVVIVVLGVIDGSPGGVAAGVLVAALSWLVLLRPRVGTRGTDLVLRGIISTVVIPLASIERVAVRQVLAVWAGGRRYVSAAVGHTFRDINRQRRGAGTVEEIPIEQRKYADHIEDMITSRSREARRDGAPMGPAHREWAWPELGGLALLVVVLVVALVV